MGLGPQTAHRRPGISGAASGPAIRLLRVGTLLAAVPLAGCVSSGAPAVPLLGAFFPSWLLSMLAGVAVAIVARVVFVKIGLDDTLPARLLVYLAIATIAGLLISTLAFGR